MDEADPEIVEPYWESRNGHALAAARYLLTAKIFPPEVLEAIEPGNRVLSGTWKAWNEFPGGGLRTPVG